MADFRLRRDADHWFRHIGDEKPFSTKFDVYYLCFILGLAAGRRSSPTTGSSDAPGFVDSFTREHKPHERLIAGIVLIEHLKHMGLSIEDRRDVNRIVAEIFGSEGLSSDGVALLNQYASGGFDFLLERYGNEPPRSIEEFLPRFVNLISAIDT